MFGKRYPYNKEDENLFKDVVFLVECTYQEMHSFWEKHHYRIHPDIPYVKEWESEGIGHTITIGEVDKRPINISIFYAKLNKKRVLFYEGISQLVDHKMIEEWIKHFTLQTIRWDNDVRWAHCDSTNFHHCLDAIGVIADHQEYKKHGS